MGCFLSALSLKKSISMIDIRFTIYIKRSAVIHIMGTSNTTTSRILAWDFSFDIAIYFFIEHRAGRTNKSSPAPRLAGELQQNNLIVETIVMSHHGSLFANTTLLRTSAEQFLYM